MDKVVRECAETILEETASVKRLVDEFSQFSRLPAAQPVTCELNDVVASGLGVFAGRLEGIELRVDLAPGLPQVSIDPEQFKRVVVNLIDNAAEAMQDSPTEDSDGADARRRGRTWWRSFSRIPAAASRRSKKRSCFFRTFPPKAGERASGSPS